MSSTKTLLSVSQCLLKSHLSCLAGNIYFVLNSAKVKKIGNVTVKNYSNESFLSLVLYYLRSRFFRKGFDVNCQKFNCICSVKPIVCAQLK